MLTTFIKRPFVSVPVILLLVVMGLALYLDPLVRKGKASDYWEKACGIEVAAYEGEKHYIYSSGVFPARDDWYIYYLQRHHDQPIFEVKKKDIEALLPEVVAMLSSPVTASKNRVCAAQGGDFCQSELRKKNKKRENCFVLLEQDKRSEKAFRERIARTTTSGFGDATPNQLEHMTREFESRWRHAKFIWITCGFEISFLVGWWLFTFAPRLWPRRAPYWQVNLMLSPLLLMIPYYLGYAPFLFTFGPSGGIVYPGIVLLVTLPVFWTSPNAMDASILSLMPSPLGWFSQVPGSAMAWSSPGSVGPLIALVYGIALVLVVSSVAWVSRRIKKLIRRK